MHLNPTAAAAEAHRHALLVEGRTGRLAALAACCRPSALRRSAARLLAWARAGQLGAGYVDPRHPQPGVQDSAYFRPCCA